MNSTERFSSRVQDYIKYRPHYPDAVLELLVRECGLSSGTVVADIGSGTGISTEMFLRMGCRTYGVEPNEPMRHAAEELLSHYNDFISVDAAAETTTLESGSIDMVVCGQSFHWFKQDQTRAEFLRILKPGGWCVLMWNERLEDTTPFLIDYEALLQRFGTDYNAINHRQISSSPVTLEAFYGGNPIAIAEFDNDQVCDYDALQGRLLSSSYVPGPDSPNYEPMLEALRALFEQHQSDGTVVITYRTCVYYGRL